MVGGRTNYLTPYPGIPVRDPLGQMMVVECRGFFFFFFLGFHLCASWGTEPHVALQRCT